MRCLNKVFGEAATNLCDLKRKTNQRKYFLSFLLFCVPTSLLLEIVGDFLSSSKVMNSNVFLVFFFFLLVKEFERLRL